MIENKGRVILANLNINTISNKFSSTQELVSNKTEILVIEEMKLDETFPEGCFNIPGYKRPFRRDLHLPGSTVCQE